MRGEITYNEQYLIRDGHPWFPVMGEFHFSRYRADLWEESLRKMKAAGVSVVSAYVIWIHHEEIEGQFDFSGCRDLGGFLRACERVGMEAFLRLGPFAHGEVRNGGLPDWLLAKKEIQIRSNDREYLYYTERYWRQVYDQTKDFLWGNGGPVIGMQIENEYGHVGGLRGEEGEAHMRTLTVLAEKIGFRLPLVTATGWGGACIGDLLPVMGGYCEAPWDKRITELEPNANYVFSHTRNDALIASDYEIRDAITFDESEFPFLTAELGGGLQVSLHRRPIVSGKDIGAMSTVKLGSGVALLGYYMFHGGSNPEGKLSTLQESTETGSYSDVPEINYDFQAPIRQFGTISDNLKEIKLLALYLEEWGEDIAALPAEIGEPSEADGYLKLAGHSADVRSSGCEDVRTEGLGGSCKRDIRPGDLQTLRLSWRHDEKHGYVFFNNYVRRRKMAEHEAVVLTGRCTDTEAETFPAIQIHDGEYGFFPYRMKLGNAKLRYALATPLCRLRTEAQQADADVWVFYGDWPPVYSWEGEKRVRILHLSRKDALNAWKITLDRDYLVLSDNFVWEENGKLCVVGGSDTRIRTYPALSGHGRQELRGACDAGKTASSADSAATLLPGFRMAGQEGEFTVYERGVESDQTTCTVKEISSDEKNDRNSVSDSTEQTVSGCPAPRSAGAVEYEIGIHYSENRQAGDLLLHFTWGGDRMEIYARGKKINDYFYTNGEDLLSLRYFDYPERLRVVVYELREDAPIFLEQTPRFTRTEISGARDDTCPDAKTAGDFTGAAQTGRACELTAVRPEALFW